MQHLLECIGFITVICWISSLSGYIFSFSNHSHDTMKIRVQLAGIDEPWEEMILPGKEYKEFRWTALGTPGTLNGWKVGFCLQNIQVATPRITKKEKIDEDGNVKIVYEPLLDSLGKQVFNPWRNVVVTWVKNEAYQAIISAGQAFADGASGLASDIASVALGGVPMPQFKLSGIAGAIGTWVTYSFCANRHFDIVEDADFSSPTEKSYKFLVEARG